MGSDSLLINILAPLLFILLCSFIFYLGRNTLSSNLFLISCYTAVIVILFFTYGKYIESLSLDNQLNYFIDNETSTLKVLLEASGYPTDSINNNLEEIKPDPSMDNGTKKLNRKILEEGIIFASVILVVGFSISYLLWKTNKEFNYRTMIYHNIILLFFVFIVEIIYFTCLSKNYRVLDSNEVNYNFYLQLDRYANGRGGPGL